MKNKKVKDILLVARPDHSMQIYRALLKQEDLSFQFITFKVVREFIKKIIPYKKLQTVGNFSQIAIRPTFIQVCKKTFYFRFAQKWKTDDFLSPYVCRELNRCRYRIIHYWPEYASSSMNEFICNKNDTVVLADMYMPNPEAIMEDMEPIYQKYGLPTAQKSWLADYAEKMKMQFKYVTDIVVPSSYVKETMLMSFPNKRYHIIPYGIDVSPNYKKKQSVDNVKSFVYVGRVSVEKGCDIVLSWFAVHPEKEIHLYGGMWESQKNIFEKYWDFPNIHYHGSVSKEELKRVIPQCDAGIHMSRFDAYSLAVGEIIGCGLPIIVSNNTGNKDDIIKYNLGIVSDLSIDSFEQSIKQISDAETYNDIVNSIDKYINMPKKDFGNLVIDLYNEILNSNGNTK